MKLIFSGRAWSDYLFWRENDPRTLDKVNALIKECQRTPFSGSGKPEPLKGELKGFWSRRITAEHRLVYRVTGTGEGQSLEIAACRYHYV
ncbi:Txe/YoeB family addiction module toxin [Pseudomonas sp. R2.Fl]|nr:Txe/YoeB family addiction module toxin [Pseudomonas sp. R2.Fl]